MTSLSCVPQLDHNASEYLAVLQALSREVTGGIAALTANHLGEFKEHLARQEDMCSRLQDAAKHSAATTTINPPVSSLTDDQQLAERIRAGHRQLSQLNRRYAALILRSTRSVVLLRAHCRTYLDGFEASSEHSSARHILSSEV
jgi:hypothetical protein